MHPQLGEYHVGDVEFVAAFDVDATKVGSDLADALKSQVGATITHRVMGEAFRGPWRPSRPHYAVERRWQHGL